MPTYGAGAVGEFDAALSLDANDTVAVNNRAVCRMYACNLPGAIRVRQDCFCISLISAGCCPLEA